MTTPPEQHSKWVFSEIVNNVAGLMEKMLVSRQDRTTAPTTTDNENEIEGEKETKEGGDEEIYDEKFAVQKFFEKLNKNNGNTLRPLQKEADKEIGGVVYTTWNPLGEMSSENVEGNRYHTGKVLYSGILWKQGRKPHIWKERFFILRETGLTYYTHKDPFTQDAVLTSIKNEDEFKPSPVHKNTIHLKRKKDKTKETGGSLIQELKKKAPHPRGNVFFVDVITPRGRVVEDLNWLSSALKGNRENCFLIQTHHSMFALAARNEDEKIEWEKQISKAFDKFVQQMIRKVAIMELAWSFGEEFSKIQTTPTLTGSKVKTEEVKIDEKLQKNKTIKSKTIKKEGFLKKTKRRGSMLFRTKRGGNAKTLRKDKDGTLKYVATKNDSLKVQGIEVEAKPEPSGDPTINPAIPTKTVFQNMFKKTLERTKKKIGKNVDVEESTSKDDERVKKQIKKAKKRARGSLSRMAQHDKLRISSKRVGVVLNEAMQGLTSKYEEQLQQRKKKKILSRCFIGWLYYVRLVKLSEKLNLTP